jgi:hypothetical protein
MTDDEVLSSVREYVCEVRAECVRLQRVEARQEGAAVAELRRMASVGEFGDGRVFDLCRLLFRSRDGGPLRQRWSCSWELIGGAKADDCPCSPHYVVRGIPFNIAIGLRHMGMVEHAETYLSYCLEVGVWNPEPFQECSREQVLAAASELVERGPWRRPLIPAERDWLQVQVPMG